MTEYLSEINSSEFEKLFFKAIKKYEFRDIRLSKSEKCILLYKEGENYVGFLEGVITFENEDKAEKIGHIVAVYVLPNFRNEGKAHSMISEFENWLKTRDCKTMFAGMPLKNKKSMGFFENVAFQNVGTCVFMKKSIN